MRTVRAAVFAALCVVLAAGGHVMMSDTALPLWSLATAFALTGGVSWALAGVERGALAVTSAAVALQAALHVGFSLVPMAQASVPVASAPSVDASVQAADARMRELAASLVCGDSGGALSLPEARRVVAASGLGDPSFPGSRAQDPGHAEGHHDGPGDGHGAGHHEDASHDAGAAPSHAPSGPAGDDPHAAHGGADAGALDHLAHVSHGGMFAAHLLAALLSGVWLAFGERAAHQILRAVVGWLFGPLALALARVPLPCAAHITPGFRRPRPLRRCFLSFCVVLRGPPVGAAVA